MAPIRGNWLRGSVRGEKALNEFVLARSRWPQDKEIKTIRLNARAKLKRPQNPILTVRTLKVLKVIGGNEIQFFFRATVIDLAFGQWGG